VSFSTGKTDKAESAEAKISKCYTGCSLFALPLIDRKDSCAQLVNPTLLPAVYHKAKMCCGWIVVGMAWSNGGARYARLL